MPYEEHPQINTPPDNTVVWRHMDFTKFVSLIEDSALFFARLSQFEDPLEGYLTKPTLDKFRNFPDDMPTEERVRRAEIGKHNLSMLKWARGLPIVSCWHASQYESAAMWRLYLKSNEGLAIRTTILRLKEALGATPLSVYLASVNYVNYDSDEIDFSNVLYLALNKRRSFEYEREVRAVALPNREDDEQLVAVHLDRLLEAVFVAPNSANWFKRLVTKFVKSHVPTTTVEQSSLEDGPLY